MDDARSGFRGVEQDARSLDVDGGETRPVTTLVRDDAGEVKDELALLSSRAHDRRLEDVSSGDPSAERPELAVVGPWPDERPDLLALRHQERDEVASENPVPPVTRTFTERRALQHRRTLDTSDQNSSGAPGSLLPH